MFKFDLRPGYNHVEFFPDHSRYPLAFCADLLRCGFVIDGEKSQWEPAQVITWFGILLNTLEGSISVTERRILKLKSTIDAIFIMTARL